MNARSLCYVGLLHHVMSVLPRGGKGGGGRKEEGRWREEEGTVVLRPLMLPTAAGCGSSQPCARGNSLGAELWLRGNCIVKS